MPFVRTGRRDGFIKPTEAINIKVPALSANAEPVSGPLPYLGDPEDEIHTSSAPILPGDNEPTAADQAARLFSVPGYEDTW